MNRVEELGLLLEVGVFAVVGVVLRWAWVAGFSDPVGIEVAVIDVVLDGPLVQYPFLGNFGGAVALASLHDGPMVHYPSFEGIDGVVGDVGDTFAIVMVVRSLVARVAIANWIRYVMAGGPQEGRSSRTEETSPIPTTRPLSRCHNSA